MSTTATPIEAQLCHLPDDHPVDLNGEELDMLRRSVMAEAVIDLRAAAGCLDQAATYMPWDWVKVADAQGNVRLALETLVLLDKLGWPQTDEEAEQ